MAESRRRLLIAIPLWLTATAAVRAQSLGPTSTESAAVAVTWPALPPRRIYVLPFAIDPALQEELRQQASSGSCRRGRSGR
jgi:hypothetical protein